ncbi:MAG: hypothetical protein ACRCUT_10225 [Spirochaetota bacterium]
MTRKKSFTAYRYLFPVLIAAFSLFPACSGDDDSDDDSGFIYDADSITDSVTTTAGQGFALTTSSTDVTQTLTADRKYSMIIISGKIIAITAAEYTTAGKLVKKTVLQLTADTAPAAFPVAGTDLTLNITSATATLYLENSGKAPRMYTASPTGITSLTLSYDAATGLYTANITITSLSMTHPNGTAGTATMDLSGIKAVGQI